MTDDGEFEFVCNLSPEEEDRATKQWEEWRRNRRIELGLPPDNTENNE